MTRLVTWTAPDDDHPAFRGQTLTDGVVDNHSGKQGMVVFPTVPRGIAYSKRPSLIEAVKKYCGYPPEAFETGPDPFEEIDKGPPAGPHCPKCLSEDYIDIRFHGGLSEARECARCHYHLFFTVWYGEENTEVLREFEEKRQHAISLCKAG